MSRSSVRRTREGTATARRARPHARRAAIACFTGLTYALAGCYTYAPVATNAEPQPGARIAVDVNDRGRVALGDKLAPGITRLEGVMRSVEGDQYALEVYSIHQIRGGTMQLAGEPVRVAKDHIASIDERRYSPRRTWTVIGSAAAVVAAFLISRGVGGRGTPPESRGEPPGEQ